MKLKGINVFEQHVEKIVLGVVTVLLLAVVAMQFVLQPNAVEVDGRRVGPDQIYTGVEGEAQRLRGELDDLNPDLPELATPDLLNEFIASVTPREGGAGTLAAPLGMAMVIDGAEQEWDPDLPVLEMRVPAPTETLASSYILTLDPFEVAETPGLMSVLGPGQPYDVRSVTVEARVNGEAFRTELEGGGDTPEGFRPMNRRWWRNALAVMQVQAERERFDPRTGRWVDRTTISATPGRDDLVGELMSESDDGEPTMDQLAAAASTASSRQAEVQRPRYYTTIAGERWQQPSERGSELEAIERRERMNDIDREINNIEAQIAQIEETMAGPRNDPNRGAGRRTGGGRQSGGSTSRGDPDRPAAPTQQEQAEARLQNRLDALAERRDGLLEEFNELAPDDEEPRRARPGGRGNPGGFTGRGGIDPTIDPTFLGDPDDRSGRSVGVRRGPQRRPGTDDGEAPFLFNESLPVWVHDIEVEPGATYRYRVRIVLNNPMFGREDAMIESQQDLAASPLVEGPWGDWSESVAVDPELYYFVQSASDRSELSTEPLAGVDMYRYWYGYWRRGDSLFRPGTPLSVTPAAPVGLVTADQDLVDPDTFFRFTEELDDYRLRHAAWREAQQRGERSDDDERPGAGARNPQGDQDAEEEPERPEFPEGITEVEIGRLSTGVFLLDVAQRPLPRYDANGLARSGSAEVLFLAADGRVLVRSPEADSESLAYRRVRLNARDGVDQSLVLSPSP